MSNLKEKLQNELKNVKKPQVDYEKLEDLKDVFNRELTKKARRGQSSMITPFESLIFQGFNTPTIDKAIEWLQQEGLDAYKYTENKGTRNSLPCIFISWEYKE